MIPSKEEMRKALAERIGEERLRIFESSTLAIAGLGGLGSNIAVMLARAGIGKLILVDFDRVDISNLNRQQYRADQIGLPKTQALEENIRSIAPYINIETAYLRITEDNVEALFKDADVILEAFDGAEEKAMLANKVLTDMPDKYYVSSSGMAGFEDADLIKTRKISDRFYLCGDGVSDVKDSSLVSTRVCICAAHEAHKALQILIEKKEG